MGTCISPRVPHRLYPGPGSTQLFPSGNSSATGHNQVRQERDISGLGSPVWKVPGSSGMNTAQRGSARLERMEPCARSRWAVSEEQRPTCLPHPRGARCAEALFGPYCPGAGCWRCPRQVGRGNSPAHSKWPFPPHPVPQCSCYGLPGRLPWVTGPRKRERAWDGGSVRAGC